MMKTKPFSSRWAAASTAGALLLVVFASGCATTPPPTSAPTPDNSKDRTIHVPPGHADHDSKDGPVRHRRHHHRMMPPPVQMMAPAPITHPGG